MDPALIARTVAAHAPDVVALQEPPTRWGRRKAVTNLEAATGYTWVTGGRTAVLVAPRVAGLVRSVTRRSLPWKITWLLPQFPSRRGFSAVDLGMAVVLSVHLGLNARERELHRTLILAAAHRYGTNRVIIAGDFNEPPDGPSVAAFSDTFSDAALAGAHSPLSLVDQGANATFPARKPQRRIDYIFVGHSFKVQEFWTVPGPVGSDHLPIMVRLEVGSQEGH